MIRQQQLEVNGKMLVRTYSDAGKYIIQIGTGIRYEDAVDIPNKHSYIESEENILAEKVEEEIKEE